jgi:WD40 repeat protein
MSNAFLQFPILAFSLIVMSTARGEDDAFGDPLPKGAKLRLGSTPGALPPIAGMSFPLPPDYSTFLLQDTKGVLFVHDLKSNKSTEVSGRLRAPAADPKRKRPTVFAVSADGKRVATSQDRALIVREIASGKEIAKIATAEVGEVLGIAPTHVSLSSDGTILAFLSRLLKPGKFGRPEVIVFDLASNKELARFETASVYPALSPDGKRIAAHTGGPQPDGQMRIWDIQTIKPVATLSDSFSFPGTAARIEFSPDGKILAASDGQGVIRLWDAETGEARDPLLAPPGHGAAIAFSPGTKRLASLNRDWTVERWSLADGKRLPRTPYPENGSPPPGRYLLQDFGIRFATEDRILVWGTLSPQAPGASPTRLVAWEPLSGKIIAPSLGHTAGIQVVQFANGGREVVTLGADQRLVSWDAKSGVPLKAIPIKISEAPGFLTNVGPGAERGLRGGVVYDLKAGEDDFVLPGSITHPSTDFSLAVCFFPSRDRREQPVLCHIWDLGAHKRLSQFELPPTARMIGPGDGIAVAFTPNRDRLLTAVRYHENPGAGAPILFNAWDVKTGRKLSEFIDRNEGGDPIRVAASSDGSGVVVTSSGEMWAVDYEKGVKGYTIERSPVRGQRLSCPTFHPDGKLLAVGIPLEDRKYGIRIYDWPRGKALHTFNGHTGPVNTLAFSPDGKTLASGSQDTTVLLWDLSAIEK